MVLVVYSKTIFSLLSAVLRLVYELDADTISGNIRSGKIHGISNTEISTNSLKKCCALFSQGRDIYVLENLIQV